MEIRCTELLVGGSNLFILLFKLLSYCINFSLLRAISLHFYVCVAEQVRNAERVQLDQIPLPDAPVDDTSKSF